MEMTGELLKTAAHVFAAHTGVFFIKISLPIVVFHLSGSPLTPHTQQKPHYTSKKPGVVVAKQMASC